MSNKQLATKSEAKRLYTGFITSLRVIQLVAYFFAVAYFVVLFSFFNLANRRITLNNLYPIATAIILTCIVIYMITQGMIALIDLLSRIEKNTRPE